ncbi:cytochrome P450 [Wolfiporia cocos MD-104 SS10]|uniref:Cytochrome P450 n=1 Tax=Wolfiporia cocos (strain MD-104) TaxID=742152 RepID=A0A2H3K271_WOLCO|nr:cytochrome P450 [Wolfiporia cocos MD-104 SS10]
MADLDDTIGVARLLTVVQKPTFWLALIPAVVIVALVVPYLYDPLGLRVFPGPILAKLTSGWMAWTVNENRWSVTVEKLHHKYGIFVRLSPDHVSIAHPAALNAIYGHSAGATKAPFYDAFSNFRARNMFNTRSRTEHSRKRRNESHMFSPQSVRALEGTARVHHSNLVSQWDKLCSYVPHTQSGGAAVGNLGACEWRVDDGRVWFNCMPCDLAFGAPFGMLLSGRDTARVAKSLKASLAAFGASAKTGAEVTFETEEIPAAQVLNERAELTAVLGWVPSRWHSLVQRLPAFRTGKEASPKMAGLAVAAVAKRISNPDAREDMLNKLLESRDENGEPLSADELSAEAFLLIIAGADTVANTSCATTYYIARDPRIQAKLQAELDEALNAINSDVAPYDAVKHLPYLDAVINEGLRVFSTVGAGPPRVVPEGGMTVLGHHFKEGTCVSVPVYHLHHDERIWGDNADEFYPERWIEATGERKKAMLDAFAPFSLGPR